MNADGPEATPPTAPLPGATPAHAPSLAHHEGKPDPDPDRDEPISPPSPMRRWRAVVGSVLGIALVILAIAAVATRHQELGGAWDALRAAPAWMVVLALVLPLLNWLVVSLSLWVITARHGPVQPGEMLWLVAGAWLLNYLPMRPGMFGRIAYHRKVNGIPIKTSMGLIVLSMGLTASAIAILAVLALAMRWATTAAFEVGILLTTAAAIAASAALFRWINGPWRLATALLLRYFDMLVWVARYWVVFALVGRSLSFEQACAIAAVSQAATAVPLSGNGLGLREWAVGLSAAALPAWFGEPPTGVDQASATTTLALAADLVNRGVEMAIALPVGLTGLAWVTRRLKRQPRPPSVPESPPGPAQPPVPPPD